MWKESANKLTLSLTLPSFMQAVVVFNSIALLAEQANHHPDMQLSYNRLHLTLTTHDAGNTLTQKDRDLAAAIANALTAQGLEGCAT